MAKKSKKRNQQPSNAPRNFVHVHGLTFNKSAVHEDRRKAQKSGKRKHKTAWVNTKDPGGFSLWVAQILAISSFQTRIFTSFQTRIRTSFQTRILTSFQTRFGISANIAKLNGLCKPLLCCKINTIKEV